MIISPVDSPSQGLATNSKTQSFTPINFSEMIKYSEEYETCKTELQKYLLDISWVKKKFNNWEFISLVDLDYYIFLMKKISVSSDTEFVVERKCTDCDKLNILNLDTTRIGMPLCLGYDVSGVITLSEIDYKYKVPYLDDFEKILLKISRFKKHDLRIIKLISLFPDFEGRPNDIEKLVVEATGDDIVRLLTLENMYLSSKVELDYKCSSCKEGSWSISINILIDNVFQSLLLTRESIETKITTKPIPKSQ